MFSEVEVICRQGGIEVVTGSMFSGKTEELLRRLRRARFAKQNVLLFKPQIDTRYSETQVVSHEGNAIDAQPVGSVSEMLSYVDKAEKVEVVGIDEAQFFDNALPEACMKLADSGIRVVVAGLDMDFKGKPFGPMPLLMSIADDVQKVHAICVRCGSLAQFSHRTSGGRGLVVLGETDCYEPLCRRCYQQELKTK